MRAVGRAHRPLTIWPIQAVLYDRLARQEEGELLAEFSARYAEYRCNTGMFLPRLFARRPRSVARTQTA